MSPTLAEAAKLVAKAALGRRLLLPPSLRVVLVYHDISATSSPQHSRHYSTTPDTFARHLDVLQECFDFVPLDDIVSAASGPWAKPLAALTFDDGFRSTMEQAQPLLKARGIPFTLFVNSLAMRENRLEYLVQFSPPPCPPGLRFYLDPDEVTALSRAGVHIGSHTSSHLTLADRTKEELDQQITSNKSYLESLLNLPVRHLALPYGKKQHYDRRAIAHCFSAGHHYVYSTNPCPFGPKDLAAFNRQAVPRIGLSNESREELLFVLNRPLFRNIDI